MRKISIILVFSILIALFITACGGADENVTSGTESTVSKIDEVSKAPEISVLTDETVKKGALNTVVSYGAKYDSWVSAADQYADTYSTELTDGIRCETASYQDQALSGYNINGINMRITLDLGFLCEKVYAFKAGYLSTTQAGINAPALIMVDVSADGKKFLSVGSMTLPAFVEDTMQEGEIKSLNYLNARYVRFTIQGKSAWTFLDELIVIADVSGTDANAEYYQALNNAYNEFGTAKPYTDGIAINKENQKTLISQGAQYIVSGSIDTNFPDSGNMLTDGIMTGYYEGKSWVGFTGGEDVTVKIDLGNQITDIANIEASFFANKNTNAYLPVAIKVAAITKDNVRIELGVMYGNAVVQNGAYCYQLPLKTAVKAQYIEFTMCATDCSVYLAEEFSVYAYRNSGRDTLYPDVEIVGNGVEWGSGATNKYSNLIYGKQQQILSQSDVDAQYYQNNTEVSSTVMTNGTFSNDTNIHNGKFFKFYGGYHRTIIYDLDYISSVDKFTASFTHLKSWGVVSPESISIYLSSNGEDWYNAGSISMSGSGEDALYKGELKLKNKVKTRYVAFDFPVTGWAGCDELEVFGTQSTSGAKALDKSGFKQIALFANGRCEPNDDILKGSKDLCLLYHSLNNGYTVNDLLPYVAYVDENGTPQDVMFDSFLFLYNNTTFPSGGLPYKNNVKSDWEWVLSDLFEENSNINALNEAAGQVKQSLGLSDDFKYKVTMTIYYPTQGFENFGDIDNDGNNDSFAKYNNRIKAIKWYIDEVERLFSEHNYENIELVGYYWYHEEIIPDDTDSTQMLNDTSDYVHSKGKNFFWIPYFTSNGYNQWQDYGFDVAVMQPNYVFNLEAPYSNVTNCAKLTALYGMGLEMEICESVLANDLFYKKYMQYISAGAELGYMDDCIIMYYQSAYIYRDAAYSKNTMARSVYDHTYHFIKGDLEHKPEVLENLEYTIDKNTVYTGKFEFKTDAIMREFQFEAFVDHGYVTLNGDGSFTYYPEKDYTGEVSFSFIYNECLGWSDPCQVTINVE